VPIEVTDAFDIKAFGLELEYNTEKMTFIGVERTYLTQDFVVLDGNESQTGVIKIGGFGLSGIQESHDGVLARLVFEVLNSEGEVKIVETQDDVTNFMILR